MPTSCDTDRSVSPNSLAVIATGGTIASMHTGAVSTAPVLDPQALLSAANLSQPHRIRPLMFRDSATMSLRDMQEVCDSIKEELQDPSTAGVIVLHGTDSMEETSYLAHLQIREHRPVIFTGAQFPADDPRADGPSNIRFATSTINSWPSNLFNNEDPGSSVYVAFNNHLYCPRGIYKAHTAIPDGFSSITIESAPISLPDSYVGDDRVDIIAIPPGADAIHIHASVAAGAKGLVLSCPGAGNSTPEVVRAVEECSKRGIPVVISSRVAMGPLFATYGGGGGGFDLKQAGAIHSTYLRPPQARILLAALLSVQAPISTIHQAFS